MPQSVRSICTEQNFVTQISNISQLRPMGIFTGVGGGVMAKLNIFNFTETCSFNGYQCK